MKKNFICLVSIFCLLVPGAFAKRYFEIGADIEAGVGQNIMGISDILVEDLVFDLSAINNSLGSGGAKLNLGADFNLHVNLNVPAFSAGLHVVNNNFASLRLGKDLFELLGEGNEVGKPIDIEMDGVVDSFISFELPISFNVGEALLKTKFSYFVPVIFMPTPTAHAILEVDENGNVFSEAKLDFSLYSVVNANDLMAGNFDVSQLITDLTQSGGFDISFELTYPIIDELCVGGYANIPIVPGHLSHKMRGTAGVEFAQDSILGSYAENGSLNEMSFTNINETEVLDGVSYSVNRPLKFGACAYYKPFGDWLELNGMFGFATRNPFSADWNLYNYSYVEYAANMNLIGLHVFKLNLASNYIDKSFNQIVGFGIDLRIVELDLSVGMNSPSFFKSFTGEGFTAKISMNVGI